MSKTCYSHKRLRVSGAMVVCADCGRDLRPYAPESVEIVPPNPKFLWNGEGACRVHYYHPARKGTHIAYFATVKEAREFAALYTLYGNACTVELSERMALES